MISAKNQKKIVLAELVPHSKGTLSKAIAQDKGESVLSYFRNLVYSQTKVPWFHIDFSLAEPI